MATYFVPVSGYYASDKVWLVGPFTKKAEAEAWIESAISDPHIDRDGHPTNAKDNMFVCAPVSFTAAQKRFRQVLREGRVLSANVKPEYHAITHAISVAQEYLDAVR